MFRILKTSSLKSGLPPGTPIHVGEQQSENITITVMDYDQTSCHTVTPDNPEECSTYQDKSTVTWVNVDGLHQVNIIEKLCSCFNLHPLTVEDILNTTQRPKLDIFDDYLFLVLKMQTYNSETQIVDMEQVSFILGKNYLISFQEKAGDTFDGVRTRIRSNKGRIRKMQADYLVYALLDSIIDNYFSVLEKVGEEIESIEEELVANPLPETLGKIHILKREMILLRRSVWPLREVINSLARDEEIDLISKATYLYMKDLYDHTIQIIDTIETFRDIISGMLDIYLSSISNRMNEVMKVLTIFAAIFIPLTFIAGLYGMNFNTAASPLNMPELSWYYGYPFAIGLMLATAGSMILYFKKKKWF
ncbi:MAG: magnesium/cobalt transporter CorA [Proteobacteria bacterium]|nr:magnesium/cobalt transporter CorA [Pseudomonadota bacterium]MBU1138423.1 magnesium/cobalt transporter CorA [Pseudomonadota bacterium]MBU1231397.1 magnesium/cobalt transporter CorA [Pseudomonadota bacterium]MBU1418492.1 magnesium/cobalt transporter CorA [Pseudomonadota bacterium]MBU1455003.1 magnesium/cobalt transporter CorA [Pseudomonadota bacterium]